MFSHCENTLKIIRFSYLGVKFGRCHVSVREQIRLSPPFLSITQHFCDSQPADRKAGAGVSWPPCPQREGGGLTDEAPPSGRLERSSAGRAFLSVTSLFWCGLCALLWPSCATAPITGTTHGHRRHSTEIQGVNFY